jgi:hypothetical protein
MAKRVATKKELRDLVRVAGMQVRFETREVAIIEDPRHPEIEAVPVVVQGVKWRDVYLAATRTIDYLTTINPLKRYMLKWGLQYDVVEQETGIARSLLHGYVNDDTSPLPERREFFREWSGGEIPVDGWPLPVREAHRPRKAVASGQD